MSGRVTQANGIDAHKVRVLVVDDDFSTIADYRDILCPRGQTKVGRQLVDLESELFGICHSHKDFPKVDLVSCQQGPDAVDAVRQALDEHRPFAVAFVDMRLKPGMDGVQTAEQIRALDPAVQIAVVTAYSDLHPMDIATRVPPVDQLFYLQKPFHAFEVQQLVLALGAKWRAERSMSERQLGDPGGQRMPQGHVMATLKHLPAGIIVFDRRDRLITVNDAAVELFPELAPLFAEGTRYEDIVEETARRLLPEDRLFLEDSWVRDRLEWHAKSGGILEQKLRGGRWVLLVEGGGVSGETYCLYLDVSALKQREANRAMTTRMAQISQAFASFYEQMNITLDGRAKGPRPVNLDAGDAVPATEETHDAAGRQFKRLTGKLQAIAQTQRLAPEYLALNQIVGEVVGQIEGRLSRNIAFEVVGGAGLWQVHLDRSKFRETLVELIENAAQAMGGQGRLLLESENLRLDREFVAGRPGLALGDHVHLSVRDQGPGMSQEMLERAFNPFFTSRRDHLGLGLSVAYGFVRQSGGYIEIESGEDGGTTVHLYFPRAERTKELRRPPEILPTPGRRSRG
jgi:CheY-like chemotaxis protein